MTIINTNSPLRLDGPMSDGLIEMASRPAGRRDAVHAGRGDDPGDARRRARPAERRGAVHGRPGPGRPAGRAGRLRRRSPRTSTCGRARRRSGRRSTSRPRSRSGQLARRYGLPWRSSNATASNVVDAQAAYESEMAVWGAVMGGVNLLYQGAGWLEGGLTASYEKLILDAEILQMMSEVLQPVVVDEASLGLDAIAEVGPGGHFFGVGPHARALRDRVLPADAVGLAELRDVAGGRRADRHRAREPDLEAAPRRVRAAAARSGRRRGDRRLRRAAQARDRGRGPDGIQACRSLR